MEFEPVAAELLALPLEEFTARRNARSKEIRAAGDAELAAQLIALRKPSLPLWSVNRLAATPDVLVAVRDAAEAVAKAQQAGSATALRAASTKFERQLQQAAETAATALRVDGHTAGEEVVRRVREIARVAALRGGETWRRLEVGALISEPEFIDSLEMFAVTAEPVAAAPPTRAATAGELRRAEKKATGDAERAKRALAVAQGLREEATKLAAAAERAAARAGDAEAEAQRARAQADESRRAVDELQSVDDDRAAR